MAAHLHRGLLEAGHDSRVLAAGSSGDDPTVTRVARSPGRFVVGIAGKFRETRDVDVVHVHAGEAIALLLAMRATGVRTPVLATYHVGYREIARSFRPFRVENRTFGGGGDAWWYRNWTCRVHRIVDRCMLSLASRATFIARSSAVDVLGPRRAADATVIYNALPPLPEDARAEGGKELHLLWVGTPSLRKRLELLPFVLRDVRTRHPEATLGIAGVTENERPDIAALFAELGQSPYVRWLGRVRSEEVRRYYGRSRLLVVPSACEGLPMVILEALQCGTPCVATSVSGHPEIVEDGVNGYLVPPDDAAAMADRAIRLLDSPDLARRMGEAGTKTVRQGFGLQRQLREYLAIYESITR